MQAGETKRVWLQPGLTAFTRTGTKGERTPLAGEYTVSFGVPSGGGFVEHTVTAGIGAAVRSA